MRSREWQAKVLDLKSRVRRRGCGARGRAVVSVKWGGRAGESGLFMAPAGARDQMWPLVWVRVGR